MRWALAGGLAIVTGLACGGAGSYLCVSDAQCVAGGQMGVCQPSGGCSFPDDDCESGQRYGELVADEVAGTCVPTDADSTAATGESSATPTSTDPSATSDASSPASTVALEDSGVGADASEVDDGPPDPSAAGTGASGMDEGTTGAAARPVTLVFGERSGADVSDVTRDTFLTQAVPTQNNGAHVDLHLIESGSPTAVLVAFDLGAIEPGSQVLMATLEVWTEAGGLLDSGQIEIHRMLESWSEGTGDYSPGIPNWIERTATEPWTTEGAGPGSSDNDRMGTLGAYVTNQAYTADLPLDIVQAWVDDPGDNHGMGLFAVGAGNSNAWYASSEAADADTRPSLTVTFVPTAP